MENATKALLIAGGILISILIITLMVNLFNSTGKVVGDYNKQVEMSDIEKFNSNFTQYLSKELSIHDVVTICNYANNNNIHKVNITSGAKTVNDIYENIEKKYKLNIISFIENRYVDNISFTQIVH